MDDLWQRLEADMAEQLAGIAPPVMFPPADPERLHDITPAPWANGHEGADL